MATMTYCACGRRMSKYARKCGSCYDRDQAAYETRVDSQMATIHRAIKAGARIEYGPNTIPARNGAHLKFLTYTRESGVWSVDDQGGHWSHGGIDERFIQQAMAFVPPVSDKHRFGCQVTYVCTCDPVTA